MALATCAPRKSEIGVDKKVTYTIKEQRDFRRSPNEALAPKIVLGIPEKLNKRDQGTPRVRSMDNEAFHEDPCDDFPQGIVVGVEEQIKE